MPYTNIFNINPYYDDFDAEKGFLRVLFKPGYAVQARELTQLQTILQDQISTVGDHLFKDGSRIVGGGVSIKNSNYAMISLIKNTGLKLEDLSDLVGGYIENANFKGRFVHYLEPDSSSDGMVVIVYDALRGSISNENSAVFFKNGEKTATANLEATNIGFPTTGTCKLVTVESGLFYVDGFFVRNAKQSFSPYRVVTSDGYTYRDFNFSNFTQLSKKIGFTLVRDSVIESEDSTLRDPAIGSYNYNAPGADRYKIVPTLLQIEITEDIEDFVELLRFETGRVTRKSEKITYGDIQKILAQRTYDESGSYTVYPFDINLRDSSNADTIDVVIGTGKAYVYGVEVDNQFPQVLSINRARAEQTDSKSFLYSVGNYIGVSLGNTGNNGVSLANNYARLNGGSSLVRFFSGTTSAPGTLVATGYVHGLIPDVRSTSPYTGYNARMYLYGVSGSISGATTAFIYETASSNGLTVGTVQSIFGAVTKSTESTLVYPIQPGYAVSDIDFSMTTKVVTDPITATKTGTVTKWVVDQSKLGTALPGLVDTGAFSFFEYDNTTIAGADDLNELAIIATDTLRGGQAFTPPPGVGTTLSSSSDLSSISLEINNAPTGYDAGSFRLVVPVKYTPNTDSFSSLRYKVSVNATKQFNSYTDLSGPDEYGRVYFDLNDFDVYTISSVVLSGTSTSIADDFELDDGGRETYYEKSRLYLKTAAEDLARYSGQGSNTVFTVSYSRFDHRGPQCLPFVGLRSYLHADNPTFTYGEIPLYTSNRTGKTVSLANCLDFRRRGVTSGNMIKPYGSSEFSVGDGSTEVNYGYYLPRIDKLCVKADPDDGSPLFFVVTGVSDISPVAPPDPLDALVLTTFTVPAYTHNVSDVSVSPIYNQRYTMSDIGKLEKRIDDVEVFAKLSISEAEIEARSLRGTTSGIEPIKTSVFADEFYGHSVADVVSSEHECSIDFERGELRPFFRTSNVELEQFNAFASQTFAGNLSGVTISSDGLLTLDYTTTDHVSNLQYTTKFPVNSSGLVSWLGWMRITPQVIPFYDTGYRPVVKTNSLSENDAWVSSNANSLRGFGTQWNDWESIWTGVEKIEEEQDELLKRILEAPKVSSSSSVPNINSGNSKVGVRRNVESINEKNSNFIRSRKLRNRIRSQVGSKIVDRTVVPYIPSKTLTVTVWGLKPNTENLYFMFDGVDQTSAVVTSTGIGSIRSDTNGSCTFQYTIPAGRFFAGNKSVRVSDSLITENSLMAADGVVYCSGVMVQQESGSYSTRPPTIRRSNVYLETTNKDPFNKIGVFAGVNSNEPVSQTFRVDPVSSPEGIVIKSVSLYFSKKDADLPIAIDIRPTVSGYPSPSVVIPFSTVVLLPSNVNASEDQPTETVFTFTSPVYLEPGEYAITITTNSAEYTLYAAKNSLNGIDNGDATQGRAGNNQLVGSLFTPQGTNTNVLRNDIELMFKVSRCAFLGVNGLLSYPSVTGTVGAQIIKFYSSQILPNGCDTTGIINGNVFFKNSDAVYLNSQTLTDDPSLTYSFTRSGITDRVSPVVDLASHFAAGIKAFSSDNTFFSSYVSRVVELPENLASNGVDVFLDANIPIGADVQVFYRTSLVGESEIFSKPWIEMSRVSPNFTSDSDIDFSEVRCVSGRVPQFITYQIKVRLLAGASNPVYKNTPALRSIRAVSHLS
jgi:hypothetical protein